MLISNRIAQEYRVGSTQVSSLEKELPENAACLKAGAGTAGQWAKRPGPAVSWIATVSMTGESLTFRFGKLHLPIDFPGPSAVIGKFLLISWMYRVRGPGIARLHILAVDLVVTHQYAEAVVESAHQWRRNCVGPNVDLFPCQGGWIP
jgi:hypothetical protein